MESGRVYNSAVPQGSILRLKKHRFLHSINLCRWVIFPCLLFLGPSRKGPWKFPSGCGSKGSKILANPEHDKTIPQCVGRCTGPEILHLYSISIPTIALLVMFSPIYPISVATHQQIVP